MITEILIQLFERDFDRLKREIEAYEKDADMWVLEAGIHNSGGNLCLHILGNLQHFVGAVLGKSGYVRDREFEFSGKDVPRGNLIQQLETTREVVLKTLKELNTEKLESIYPLEVFRKPMRTAYFLVHLQGHLNYHLGQINYHRRQNLN